MLSLGQAPPVRLGSVGMVVMMRGAATWVAAVQKKVEDEDSNLQPQYKESNLSVAKPVVAA